MNWYNPFKKISKLEYENNQLKLEIQLLEEKLVNHQMNGYRLGSVIKHWRLAAGFLGVYSIAITGILVLTINFL